MLQSNSLVIWRLCVLFIGVIVFSQLLGILILYYKRYLQEKTAFHLATFKFIGYIIVLEVLYLWEVAEKLFKKAEFGYTSIIFVIMSVGIMPKLFKVISSDNKNLYD